MSDTVPLMTPDEEVLDVKRRSRSLRALLDRVGVSKFREDLPRLEPIRASIDLGHTLETAKYIYRVVKDERLQEVFFRDPRQALTDAGLGDEVEYAEVVVQVVRDLISMDRDPHPIEIFDSYTKSESNTHQQWNFDSSGRSAETTRGHITGENTKFDGYGLVEDLFTRPDFGEVYFPAQPLVTPELIHRIRERLSPELRGAAAKE